MDQVVCLTTLVEYLWHVCMCVCVYCVLCMHVCVCMSVCVCAVCVNTYVSGEHVHLLGCFTLDIWTFVSPL